ncbi:MAG: aldehyde ferredoxin oxidoreductase family protein, partial [Candidatus Bathyarchaeota archaeon]
MASGYIGKWLEVDLNSETAAPRDLDMNLAKMFLGGRGFGTKILYDKLKPKIDPLSVDNILIFATGPLTGGSCLLSPGRHVVCTKSPLTGTILDTHSGGHWGPFLKKAGFDYIQITGKAKKTTYLWVHDGNCEFKDASGIWGKMDVFDAEDVIKKETDKGAKVAQCGPPGERKALLAAVMNDKYRAAGRGGAGAVMGSKNLKAIAVFGDGEVMYSDSDGFKAANKEVYDVMQESDIPKVGGSLNTYGTAVLVNVINEHGILPTRNFQTGVFEGANKISGETLAETRLERRTACWGCPIVCGRWSRIESGPQKGTEGEGPEYETLWSLGATCGVDDLDMVSTANWLCNKYGLDTISAGGTVAFAMECYERKLISKEDTGGIDLKFGDGKAMTQIIELMGKGEGIGAILQDGSWAAAKKIGKGSEKFSMTVKGMEIPAYDPRGAKGHGLAYATSNRGACHLRAYMISPEIIGLPEQLDRFSGAEDTKKIDMLKTFQDLISVVDSAVVCQFVTFGIGAPELVKLLKSCTGWDWTVESLQEMGDRIWTLERAFNAREGFGRKDDTLPD